MLTSLEIGILTLIRNALNGEKRPLPADFDWEMAYKFGKRHQILPILYYGGAHLEELVNSDIGTKFLIASMNLASFSENQLYEINALTSVFEENKIEYLKLKGTNLKGLYPHPEMRIMSDADILIREDQMPQIKGIMKALGYEYLVSSDHEWEWKKPELMVELHKRIIPSYQTDLYDYFGNGWKLAKKVEGKSEYVMSKEDEFIYLFAHLVKHYRDAGIGIKHFVDVYVFLNANPSLDMEYVKNAFKKLKLYTFFENTQKMLNAWFCDTGWDEISEFITLKVFESGVYGQKLASLKSTALRNQKKGKRKKGKVGKFFSRVFPPLSTMKNLFPILDKAPILLPFMWIWRIIRLIFTGKDNYKRYKEESKIEISDQEVSEYQCELNYVGLDYNF